MAGRHVLVKLPLVPFVIINWWRLNESEIQVQGNQSFPFLVRDSCSPFRGKMKNQETSGSRVFMIPQNIHVNPANTNFCPFHRRWVCSLPKGSNIA